MVQKNEKKQMTKDEALKIPEEHWNKQLMFTVFIKNYLRKNGYERINGYGLTKYTEKQLKHYFKEFFKRKPEDVFEELKHDYILIKRSYLKEVRGLGRKSNHGYSKKKNTRNKFKIKDQYLTREWLNLRKIVFERDNNKCRECGTTYNLQCHHEYYIYGRKVWEYPLLAFTTLCRNCHVAFHNKIKGKSLVRKATAQEKLDYKQVTNTTKLLDEDFR